MGTDTAAPAPFFYNRLQIFINYLFRGIISERVSMTEEPPRASKLSVKARAREINSKSVPITTPVQQVVGVKNESGQQHQPRLETSARRHVSTLQIVSNRKLGSALYIANDDQDLESRKRSEEKERRDWNGKSRDVDDVGSNLGHAGPIYSDSRGDEELTPEQERRNGPSTSQQPPPPAGNYVVLPVSPAAEAAAASVEEVEGGKRGGKGGGREGRDDVGVTRSVFRTRRGEAATKITLERFRRDEKEPVEKEGRPILESQVVGAEEQLQLGWEEEEVENTRVFTRGGKNNNSTRTGNVSRKVAVFEASRFESGNQKSNLVGLNRKDSLPGRLYRHEGGHHLRSRSASVDSPVKRRERNERSGEWRKKSDDNHVLIPKTVERNWKEKNLVEGRPSTCISNDLSTFSAGCGYAAESPSSRRHGSNSSSSSRSEVSSPLQNTTTSSIFSHSDGGAAVAPEKSFPNEDGRHLDEDEEESQNGPNSRLDDLIDSLERIRDEFEVFVDKSEPDSLTNSLCSPISEDRSSPKDNPTSFSTPISASQSGEVRDPAVENGQSSRCSTEEIDSRFSVSGFSVVSDSFLDQKSYREKDDHAEEALNRTMDRRLGGNRYRVYNNNTNTTTSTASTTTPYFNNGFYSKQCARLVPHLSVKAVTKAPPPQAAILYHPEPREERYPYEYYEEEDDPYYANRSPYEHHQHSSPKANNTRSLVRVKPELPAYLSLGRNKVTRNRAANSEPDVSYERALVRQEDNELEKIREILSGLDFSKYRKKPVNRSTSDCPPQVESNRQPYIRRSFSSNYPLSQPEKISVPTVKTRVTRVPNNLIPEYSGWGTNKLKELTRKLKPQMVSTAPSSPNLGLPKPTSPFSKKFPVTKRSFSYSNFDTVPEQGGPIEPQSFRQNLLSNSLVRATATLPRRKPGIIGQNSPYSLLNPIGKERHRADYLDLETRASDTRQRNSALLDVLASSRPKFLIGDSDSRDDRSEPDTPEILSSNASPWSLLRRYPSTGQNDDQEEQLPDTPPGVPERRKRRKALGTGPTVGFQMSDRNYSKSDTGRSLTYPLQNQITAAKEGGNYDGSRMSGRVYGRRPTSDISTGVSGNVYGDSFKSDALEEQMTQDSFDSNSGSMEDRNKSMKKKHHSDPGAEKPQLVRSSKTGLSELMASSKSEPYLGDYSLEDEEDSISNPDVTTVGKPSRITGSQTLPRREPPNRSVSVSSGTWTKNSHRRYGSDGGGGPPTSGIYSSKFPDSESDSKSPQQQRRYYKKRLRGPYGEMLEEEMRKYGAKLKNPLAEETSELEDSPVVKTPGNSLEVRRRPVPPSTNQALEDPELKRSNSSPGGASAGKSQVLAKRKVSANIPLLGSAPSTTGISAVSSSLLSLPGTAIASLTHSSEPSLVRQASSESGGSVASATSGQLSRWSGGEDDKSTNEESWRVLDAEKYSDTRTHVVGELYDTEHSYVESLQILVNKYMKPLKGSEYANMVDGAIVDEIFYQIPEILNHHESFLELLRQRLTAWDTKQIIGDVFVEAFTKQPIVDTYTAFINNWKSAKEAIKLAVQAKPAFAKFLEHMSREHKGKLPLDALLIMPVQRIPRYELLIKELLKHTQLDHPDHQLLIMAQKEVHDLAVKINRVEREAYQHEQMQQRVKDIEHLIEGVMDLVQPDRTFNRFDIVAIPGGLGKKERCFFLFSDLLLITSIKRKSGTIRKSSNVSSQSQYGSMEMNKYKLLMRFSLDNLDIAKCSDSSVKKIVKEIENLEADLSSLNQISDIASSLHCSHQNLDDVVRDMIGIVNKQLIDKQTNDAQLLSLDLTVTTQEGIDYLTIIFPTADKRASWEESFNEAKQKLALSTDRRPPPEFMYPLPIRKTRAGLQFTCSASTLGLNSFGLKDVWVCNSDGYVGQVCVLSLQPEPTLTSCNGVCNARILCAMSIPAAAPYYLLARRKSLIPDSAPASVSIHIEDADIEEEDEENLDDRPNNGNFQLDSESSEDDDESTDSPTGEVSVKSSSTEEREEMDNLQPTMWLGTEDGCIHVYNCNDNIRIKKNKMKIQHSAAVHCIIYLDNRVFVSLASGELVIYKKDTDGGWNTNDVQRVQVGNSTSPVLRMLPVAGRLWCGCQNYVKVLNTLSLEIEKSFIVCSDSSRPVICLVTSGLGVWIAIQHSAILRLFHATLYTNLLEVNVAPAVTKMLSGCDNIIRQHKAACLRVTALLACKDLLWVGTSAGVILTLPLPHLTSTTTHLDYVPNVAGVPHGHTGHVRFLTYVEMSPGSNINCSKLCHRSVRTKEGLASRRASTVGTSASGCRFIVLSGGDGYENFQNLNTGLSEGAGHDDSTNHLLLWQV